MGLPRNQLLPLIGNTTGTGSTQSNDRINRVRTLLSEVRNEKDYNKHAGAYTMLTGLLSIDKDATSKDIVNAYDAMVAEFAKQGKNASDADITQVLSKYQQMTSDPDISKILSFVTLTTDEITEILSQIIQGDYTKDDFAKFLKEKENAKFNEEKDAIYEAATSSSLLFEDSESTPATNKLTLADIKEKLEEIKNNPNNLFGDSDTTPPTGETQPSAGAKPTLSSFLDENQFNPIRLGNNYRRFTR